MLVFEISLLILCSSCPHVIKLHYCTVVLLQNFPFVLASMCKGSVVSFRMRWLAFWDSWGSWFGRVQLMRGIHALILFLTQTVFALKLSLLYRLVLVVWKHGSNVPLRKSTGGVWAQAGSSHLVLLQVRISTHMFCGASARNLDGRLAHFSKSARCLFFIPGHMELCVHVLWSERFFTHSL